MKSPLVQSIAGRLHKELARHALPKVASRRISSPLISFTFDDFPRCALTVAGGMLSSHGLRGTYYGSLALMGTTTDVGELFTRRDLDTLIAHGHELGCHTLDHVRCCDVTRRQLLRNCAANARFAADILGDYRLRNFAFPQGAVTLSAKHALAPVYDTCRTIEPGLNRNPVDLAFLRAHRIYANNNILSLKRAIHQNARRRSWLIFYTHDVARIPSPYGCTPEYFRDILDCAIRSGAEILTIAEATARLIRTQSSLLGAD